MAAGNAGGRTEYIPVGGSVTLQTLLPLLTEIWSAARRNPGTRFRIDCSAVTDFSCQALAELAKLRRDVRSSGGDLILVHLSDSLCDSLRDPLFEPLVEGSNPAMSKTPALQGPHKLSQAKWKEAKPKKKAHREPYFLRLRGTRYQRFWLN